MSSAPTPAGGLARFGRHRLAVAGAGLVVGVLLIAVLAPHLAPQDPRTPVPRTSCIA